MKGSETTISPFAREPATILRAHEMDPGRREVFVEGQRDATFMQGILARTKTLDAKITQIRFVKIPLQAGGERGRLSLFAENIGVAPPSMMCFADADWDRILSRATPPALTLTDHRDLETYVFYVECVQHALRVGLALEKVNGAAFLDEVLAVGRKVASVRIVSERKNYALPFQETRLKRYLGVTKKKVEFDRKRFVRALVSNDTRGAQTGVDVPRILEEVEREDLETISKPESHSSAIPN